MLSTDQLYELPEHFGSFDMSALKLGEITLLVKKYRPDETKEMLEKMSQFGIKKSEVQKKQKSKSKTVKTDA